MASTAPTLPLHTSKRLIVGLLRDDLLDAINTPLRARRGLLLVNGIGKARFMTLAERLRWMLFRARPERV